MKKRLFAIMLALAMLLAAVPALAEGEGEPDKTEEKKICTTEGCGKKVTGEGNLCVDCATAKKVAEEEAAAKKAAEEEALRKAAEEEAAKKAAEEEALRKAAEEAAKKAAEGKTEGLKATPGETNQAGTGADGKCHHNHTAEWANAHPEVQGTMVEWPAKDPTCTSEGNIKYYTCTNCGGYFRRNETITDKIEADEISAEEVKIPKTKHKPTQIAAKAATCTETGIKEHYKCSVCGKLFSDSDGKIEIADTTIPALGHDYEYLWGTWDCKTKTITACRKCKREGCNVVENPTTISFSEKDRDTWYSCGKKYTTVYYNVVAKYGNETVKYGGKAECTYSTSDYCRPDWYYDPCYYNNPCGHWGCGNVCTRYSDCVPCRDYRTTFRVGGYNCLATPKTGDVSVIGMALISLAGAGAAIMGKKRK